MASNTSNTTSRLHVAAKTGDGARIKQYLMAGDDLNAVDEECFTPLMVAVRWERLKIVQLLLEAGADTSVQSRSGNALAGAASGGNTAIVKALLKAGADINAGNFEEQFTPLFIASFQGRACVVRLLIEKGCDIRIRGVSGATALYAAASKGHINIVESLLDAGLDVNETYVEGEGETVLTCAVRSGNCPLVIKLLERGADVNIANSAGKSLLHASASDGFDDITEVLLRAGADPNKCTRDSKMTPLHLACMEGHIECVRLLLLAGANVSAVNVNGGTPLHCVSGRGQHNDIIELLLSAGSDITIGNHAGHMPLFYAAKRGHCKAVGLLLEAGSDVNRCDKLGRNVLFDTSDLDVVKLLLAKGADATVVDVVGDTVLHNAVSKNASGGVICALFRAGANPTAQDLHGSTPADVARSLQHTETAKLLDLLADKYRETRGNLVDSDGAKAVDMSLVAALMEKGKKIIDTRRAETGVGSSFKDLTMDDMTNMMKSFSFVGSAYKDMEESVDECKDDQQSSSALPCLNCEILTNKRCSGCGISYFCSKKCEVTARHVCCG